MHKTDRAQMVVNIVSNDVLQLTVSKTALDVFNILSQVDQLQANVFVEYI